MQKDDLPKSWVLCSIEELVEAAPKEARDDEMEVGFVPMKELGTKFHSQHGHEIKQWKQVKKGYTQFSDGDVLLARITPCFENGKAGIAQKLPNSKGAGSTEFFVLRPFKHAIEGRLLLAYFKTTAFLEEGVLAMTGAVGQQRVPKQFVLDRLFPLPPLNEQRRIANKLETTLAAVEACKQKLNNAAETIKQFRQSVLSAAVSGELTREWREERGIEWVTNGQTIEEICENDKNALTIGPFGSNLKVEHYRETGVPLVFVREIRAGMFGDEKTKYISADKATELKSHKTRAGDLLITKMGDPPGDVAIYPPERPEAVITADVVRARLDNSKAETMYMKILLSSRTGKREIKEITAGVAQQKISLKRFRSVIFNLPSLDEQKEISKIALIMLSKAEHIEASINTTKEQLDQLTSSLLAKAFRGELVPQDPNDEPASVLLERLKTQREAEAAAKKPAKRGRKKKADPSQLDIPAGIADNHLAKALEECGALSERALLAASELEPALFRLQLSKELNAGGLKQVDVDGEAFYAEAAWEE